MSGFARLAAASALAAMGLASAASAAVSEIVVVGDKVTAKIEAAGVSADLTVGFESAANLSAANLGLSAEAVNPLDPALVSRLPGSLVSAPAGFAVLLRIEPPASGGLSFDGVTTVELYTTDLLYVAGSPLRLFSARAGGPFADITEMIAGGSYRTRGGGGHYSDFLIVADTRPLTQTISAKFDALAALLTAHAGTLGAGRHLALANQLDAARDSWLAGEHDVAIRAVEAFDAAVKADADAGGIPNRWRADGGPPNVAGELRAAARTLRFSLTLAANNL
jgi:hypothetical protein